MVLLCDKHCTIHDLKGKIVGEIPFKDDLYKAEPKKLTEAANVTHKTSMSCTDEWAISHPAT